jgi:transcription-repair coupling factor (superfamily II helicase)
VHERLLIYKRLATCEATGEIDALHEELIDRFGLPPQPVKTLIESHHLRLAAKPLGIQKLDASEAAIQIGFIKNPPIDPVKIIMLIQSKKGYRLAGQDKLRVETQIDDVAQRIVRVKEVLRELQ